MHSGGKPFVPLSGIRAGESPSSHSAGSGQEIVGDEGSKSGECEMNIVFITPGTGNYYCGVCMRDNALVRALMGLGENAVMLPMYLPILTDEPSVADDSPLFFGGINVYLQQNLSLFRHTPVWFDRVFDTPWLLSLVGRRSGMTDSSVLGEITVSMLKGESGKQVKEIDKLVDWLVRNLAVDIVFLSTILQAGLTRSLKKALSVPVHCFLQGEDIFLDSLNAPYAEQAWSTLKSRAVDIDRFVAPSHFFADVMQRRLGIEDERICVIPNGINIEGYDTALKTPDPPVIGYLARLSKTKGLGTLIEGFILLKSRGRFPTCRLEVAGTVTGGDPSYIDSQKKKLDDVGLGGEVRFRFNISRAEKSDFLRRLTLFSVPAHYGEAFGLYLLEAMASAVPVVQPNVSAFPEIVNATGGGILYEPDTPEALVDSWESLLADPELAREIGMRGRESVLANFTIEGMAETVVRGLKELE